MSDIQKLTDHLRDMAAVRTSDSRAYFPIAYLATEIIRGPQVHLNALNEAGAVRDVGTYCRTHERMVFHPDGPPGVCRWCGGDHVAVYVVIPPKPLHTHEPVPYNIHSDGQITRKCATCGEWLPAVQVRMPTTLPVEVPS